MAPPSGPPEGSPLLRIGEILGAHGVKGEVRLRSFAAPPPRIADYSPLVTEGTARSLTISALRPSGAPDIFVARLTGVASREAAEALAGTKLHVARDLVAEGLAEHGGEMIGKVVAVQNFGAGDLLEVALQGTTRTEFLPFAEAFVPHVDLVRRKIVVADGLLPSQV
jgi:16S rRNA processing protein RimM